MFIVSRLPISRRSRRALKRFRIKLSERYTSRFLWTALYDMDHRLVDLFGGKRGGTFFEIGGNDGLQQSNTLALERLYGWTGILVEANPELAGECVRNRPLASVVCAGVAATPGLTSVEDNDLISKSGTGEGITISAVTLSNILDHFGIAALDLMVIDVEGAELGVLAGLDLKRHAPQYILIETERLDDVSNALGRQYDLIDQWTHHDFLFARRSRIPPSPR